MPRLAGRSRHRPSVRCSAEALSCQAWGSKGRTGTGPTQQKARERGSTATFLVADALALEGLGRRFDVAIDCGLFHTFSDAARSAFAENLHRILRPGGRYVLLCFSEHQPGDMGPRRVRQAEIRSTFARGWSVDSIVADRFADRWSEDGAAAWLAQLRRA